MDGSWIIPLPLIKDRDCPPFVAWSKSLELELEGKDAKMIIKEFLAIFMIWLSLTHSLNKGIIWQFLWFNGIYLAKSMIDGEIDLGGFI